MSERNPDSERPEGDPAAPLSVILPALDNCDDHEVLILHRLISRRAQRIRMSDPDYLQRLRTGRAAAQAKVVPRRARG